MSDFRSQKLAEFVAWAGRHITGDEKGQAQFFLDRLFQAFGQKGSLDVGGEPEMRVARPRRTAAAPRSPTTSGSRSC